MGTLLDRLEQLENAPDRAATREADQAALATLASRGITPELRRHLRSLIQIAQAAAPPAFPSELSIEERDAALRELHAWYRDWSETARAVIHRKDYLVMLGLAKRKISKSEIDTNEPEFDEPEIESVDAAA